MATAPTAAHPAYTTIQGTEVPVPTFMGRVMTKFKEIQAQLETIEEQHRMFDWKEDKTKVDAWTKVDASWDLTEVKNMASADYLKLKDLQDCIEKHPGKWDDQIMRCLAKVWKECLNGEKLPSFS